MDRIYPQPRPRQSPAAEIIDEFHDLDAAFRTEWDLFLTVFSSALPEFGQEKADLDGWNPVTHRDGVRWRRAVHAH